VTGCTKCIAFEIINGDFFADIAQKLGWKKGFFFLSILGKIEKKHVGLLVGRVSHRLILIFCSCFNLPLLLYGG